MGTIRQGLKVLVGTIRVVSWLKLLNIWGEIGVMATWADLFWPSFKCGARFLCGGPFLSLFFLPLHSAVVYDHAVLVFWVRTWNRNCYSQPHVGCTLLCSRVVWAENTDGANRRSSGKGAGGAGKDTGWFPALIVAPSASPLEIDTKEDFLIKSFR